ncbi:putative secreted protein [Wickerhamomyces ciferrii]|uniref:Secreted protein n=1 Tax=Wickerhamomyces ciferrii (strain ATCC 14091 / BCRC 22168 / CBS 111 / JCM 3599 / NBRC 0793 / NRRL Y-1031 F-60-10) TaxID=1206466 RepID=K0KNR6_WICCF|nr:uncharacterized protein BN7_2297 [Wickerhamomyces ciferrii]CCH42753.1 putative secreted protein [Wickerhamomyces ciferrii]
MWLKTTTILLLIQSILAASPFVVQLKDTTTFTEFLENSLIASLGIKASDTSSTIEIGNFKAYVADFEDNLVTQLLESPLINDVFPNAKFNIFDTTTLSQAVASPSSEPKDDDDSDTEEDGVQVQNNAPRHLARLSSRDGLFLQKEPFKYTYDTTGEGVVAYVIDTGIAIEHPELEGRAKRGANFVSNESDGDNAGHGTHVSGLIGSKTYGVAKDVTLVEVKVLDKDGSGSLDTILRGIEWAFKDQKKNGSKAVANLSLGSYFSGPINDAVNEAVKGGLAVVVAAGNSNQDAQLFSPASAELVVTVGALDDRTDTIATFSNYGSKVDVFASGVDVDSLNINDFKNPVKFSGTSMASPIVAGLAATLLEKGVLPGDLQEKIITLSTKGAISNGTLKSIKYRNTPNRVAFNGVNKNAASGAGSTVTQPSNKDQDQTLNKYINTLESLKPTDQFTKDLVQRSAKNRGVDLSF